MFGCTENVPRVGKFVFIDPKLQKQTSKSKINLTSSHKGDTITTVLEEEKPVTKRRRRRPRATQKKENKLLGVETVE